MSAKTGIEWTDHTFNPWWGCTKISPGCANCYAERDAARYGHGVWGPTAPRRFFGTKHWLEPLRWEIAARKAGVRRRVFCASMADLFEAADYDGPDEIGARMRVELVRLWEVIRSTTHLEWLLLTKRPENIRELAPGGWPQNVRVGVSVESQDFIWRIKSLLNSGAPHPWVSYEPALGPVDLASWFPHEIEISQVASVWREGIEWVIVGGESGPGARPFDLAWARSTVKQCRAAGVPVFVKQLGARPLWAGVGLPVLEMRRLRDAKGGDPSEWPEDLRVREFPWAR